MVPSSPPGASRLRFIRMRNLDDGSAEGRTAERYRLAAWGAIASLGARSASMLLMVLTVHWAAPYLGAERFGVWATFASLAAMLSFLDLGVGNAMVNRVAHMQASADDHALRRVITGGISWLLLIGATASAGLVVATIVIP